MNCGFWFPRLVFFPRLVLTKEEFMRLLWALSQWTLLVFQAALEASMSPGSTPEIYFYALTSLINAKDLNELIILINKHLEENIHQSITNKWVKSPKSGTLGSYCWKFINKSSHRYEYRPSDIFPKYLLNPVQCLVYRKAYEIWNVPDLNIVIATLFC